MRLRCCTCRESFSWDPRGGWPHYCPENGCYLGMDDRDGVVMPFISEAKRKGPDRVYRDMEEKSELRAELAREALGADKADVAHLKMTNMRDNLREGDVAAMPVVNEVSKAMDAAPQGTVGFASQLGIQASQYTQQGPMPNAGTNFIQNVLKPEHSRRWGVATTDFPSVGVRGAIRGR